MAGKHIDHTLAQHSSVSPLVALHQTAVRETAPSRDPMTSKQEQGDFLR